MADNAWDQLKRALRQIDPLNTDGAWQLITSGTVNIVGGGSGGTSSVDNNPFTPGGTSITPAGGYQGGRQIASGNAGAFAISPSGLLLVDVRAGGAGGGIANLTVRGSGNTDLHVGYVGGGSVNSDGGAYVPILGTVNLGAGAAPFASVAVYGSPANPIYNVGSVNVVNPVGIFGSVNVLGTVTLAAGAAPFASVAVYGSPANPVYVVGSVGVTPLATYTVALDKIPTVNLGLGTVNIGNAVGIFGSVNVLGTVTLAAGAAPFASVAVYGSPANPVYVIGTVNITGGGSGFASAAVYGSPANPVYAIGTVNISNAVGIFGSVNVLGTVTLAAGAAPFASVAVYGSPSNPVYIIGSANMVGGGGSLGVTQIGSPWGVVGSVGVTPLASFTVNLGGIPTVNLGLGTINVGNNVGIFGSVNVLGSVNIGGVPVVDTRGSLVGTTWPIAHAGSGLFAIAFASNNPARFVYIYGIHVTADNSAVVSFQSPSGTFLTGSIRIPGAAGFNMGPGQLGHPLLVGASNGTLFLHSIGSGNIGGFAAGWIG